MKNFKLSIWVLLFILLESCVNTYDEFEEESVLDQSVRDDLVELLSDLSFSYNRGVLITETPTSPLLEVYSKVETLLKNDAVGANEDAIVVVEGDDIYFMDPLGAKSMMSGNIEDLAPGSHTYYNSTYLFLPCNLTVSWGPLGVFASSDNGKDCIIRTMNVFVYTSYAKIDGRVSILGTYGGTYNISGYTNNSNSWTIYNCYNCSSY